MTKKSDPLDAFLSKLFKSGKFYIALALIAVVALVWTSLPTWEEKNRQRITNQIRTINDDVELAPIKAWDSWEVIQKELKGRKIMSSVLKEQIEKTKEKMTAIYPEIQEEIKRIEAERREAAAIEAKAETERRKLKAEQDAREELRKKYRNINQEAKDAVAALKKLEAYTEVGVNKLKYQEALGVAWGNIKVFIESAEAKENYPELSILLAEAIQAYKDAADAWGDDRKSSLQLHWQLAALKIKEIDYLVNH